MSSTFIFFGIVGLAIIATILFAVSIYNRLVSLRNRFKNAFSQIDVQLKRRYDLIPNLVETAKAYLNHERETLEAVIAARNQAAQMNSRAAANPSSPEAISGLTAAEGGLTSTLGRLFALVESYPELKADQNMRQLSEELSSTENKISFARQAFNDAAMEYNTSREIFPNIIFANFLNFKEASLFEVQDEQARQTPKVAFR